MSQTQSRNAGKFDSTLTDLGRYDVIAAVAIAGRPDRPETITTRAWDDARASAGFPDAPSARAMTMHFGRSWKQLLADALSNDRDLRMVESKRTASEERSDLTLRHVRFAIQAVACARGQETLTPDEYTETRKAMIAADRRRATGGLMETLLPTVNQIRYLLGNGPDAWEKAVQDVAGLRAPKRGSLTRGMAVLDAFDLYVETAGATCGRNELKRFAGESGFMLERLEGKTWPEWESEIAASRAKRGLTMPTHRVPRGERPIVDLSLVPERYHQVKETRVITREMCLKALREFHDELPKRAARTRARYIQEVKTHPDWVWPKHFDKWGGFTRLLTEAQATPEAREDDGGSSDSQAA